MPSKKRKNYIKTGMSLSILVIVLVLTIFGVVMTYDTTYNNLVLEGSNPLSATKTQALAAVIGLVAMFVLSRLDYHNFQSPGILVTGIVLTTVLLGAVFAFEPRNNSHRWIWLTKSLSIQPSEIAKFVAVVYTAHFMTQKPGWYSRGGLKEKLLGWVAFLLPTGIFIALIFVEPDLSTTLCILGTVVAMAFIGGAPFSQILLGGGVGAGGLLAVKLLSGGYHNNRIYAWLHAWDDPSNLGFQVVQSLYAIGDGGIFGVGFGNSKQKINALPMCDTDYIFSIICEEFGFFGAFLLLCVYGAFVFLGIRTAMKAPDKFGCYTAAGITIAIGLQAFLNMAVATNVLPSTGVTLPFISHGASSLAVTLAATGILLNISSYTKRPSAAEE